MRLRTKKKSVWPMVLAEWNLFKHLYFSSAVIQWSFTNQPEGGAETRYSIYRPTPSNASEVGCGKSAKELLQEGLVVGRSAKEILMAYVA